MANTGKALTNVAFRAKMLALIDKLKNQDKTALVRHVDDFEALNKDTFEAGMNAVIEAIPEGGGGGGGYVVTFTLDPTASSEAESLICDKTIEDIIAHVDEHIVGRCSIKNFPADEDASIFCDLYCDNMKFDYQVMKSDNPEYIPMLAQYTYLGFMSDGAILSILNNGTPIDNSGDIGEQSAYYKQHIKIAYMFGSSTPYWTVIFEENGGDDEEAIETTKINFGVDYTYDLNHMQYFIKLLSTPDSDGSNVQIHYYDGGTSGLGRAEQYIFDYFIPPYLRDGYNIRRTALYSPITNGANGVQVCMYNKPAQIEAHLIADSALNYWTKCIFTIDKYEEGSTDNNSNSSGTIEMHMDEDDASNNRIIRHYIKMQLIVDDPSGLHHAKNTYKKLIIPYTVA